MKSKRAINLLIGVGGGAFYALFTTYIVGLIHESVSVSYIFILPVFLGAIPIFFSTKEQLLSYWRIIVLPWMGVLTFCFLALISGFEGMICLVVIIAPFLIIGTIAAFIAKLVRLNKSINKTPLYCSLLIPFICIYLESFVKPGTHLNTVTTKIEVNASRALVWENIKNVRNIKKSEIEPHFIHMIGLPMPLNGQLDKEGVGAVRSITWEKGIKFREIINAWQDGYGFAYDIEVDPNSIPPKTLDEHVLIGGKYFDVVKGYYKIIAVDANKSIIELACTYRITTNLNFYSKWWADTVLNDFNTMILEVVKKRSEAVKPVKQRTAVLLKR